MLDIGVSELAVIGVVSLIVLGPERLPKVARAAGHLLGRAQRYINDVKADISREMELDELRKMRQEIESAAQGVEQSIQTNLNSIEQDLSGVAQVAAPVAEPPKEDAPQAAEPPAVAPPKAVDEEIFALPSAHPAGAGAAPESAADVMARALARDASAIAPGR
jgi:sec-independent protein translocase protein TatB